MNLLMNAAQAIPSGNAEANEVRIVTTTDAGGRAVVEIRDTGPGIPPAILGRIFNPFFTTKAIGEGTGLGLSICRNIVTSLGGEIGAESEEGKGTTIRVALPAAKPEQPERPEARSLSLPPASRPGRVLVIDDDPMVATTLRRVLSKEHEVTVMTDGRQALAILLGGQPFDVILCDLMMPHMTGMDLHAALAAEKPELADRMVFITGGAFTAAARSFLDSVPNQRLEKPFAPQNIRALVRSHVR